MLASLAQGYFHLHNAGAALHLRKMTLMPSQPALGLELLIVGSSRADCGFILLSAVVFPSYPFLPPG